MPGSAADAEAFLALPCDEDDENDGGDGSGAHAVGLADVGDLIEGALEGRDVRTYMRALPPTLQASQEEEDSDDDVDASWQSTEQTQAQEQQPQRRHDGDAASAAVKRARQKQQHRRRPAAAHEGLVDEDGDDDDAASGAGGASAPAPPPSTPAARRGRDGGGWRSVEEMLSAKESGWHFLRRRGHVLFRRTVLVDASGASGTTTQTFVVPCTPSDVRAGRNARAALQRLDRGVTPVLA
jgi:hypothetical protein